MPTRRTTILAAGSLADGEALPRGLRAEASSPRSGSVAIDGSWNAPSLGFIASDASLFATSVVLISITPSSLSASASSASNM
jgi:hypothetical protein